MIDEGFVQDDAGLGPVNISALDPKTAALLQLGVSVAIGSPAVCLEWSTEAGAGGGRERRRDRRRAAGDRPVAGPGRVVAAAPELATALGYDIQAGLEEPDDH